MYRIFIDTKGSQMMNSLLGIFKKSQKADSFRPAEIPDQYNDGIAMLNSLGDNQYQKINTQTINRINKNLLFCECLDICF